MADIMQYPWVAYAVFSGIDMKEFPKLKAWEDRIMQRPLVKKGHDIPLPFTLREVVKDKEMIKKVEEAGRELVQGQMKMLREGDLR
jgi:glutathione S-transferase